MTVAVEPARVPSKMADGRGAVLVLASITSVQFGAAFARRLFDTVGPAGVVLLRQGIAAIVLMAVVRPRLRGRGRAEWLVVLAFGTVLAGMNLTFYEAVARLPLGMAVTIELLGPIGLAVALSRRPIELVWCLVALVGMLLLGEGGATVELVGVAFALAAAAGWAGYILLLGAAGRHFTGVDGVALAMVVASLLSSPFGLQAGSSLVEPRVLLIGVVVAMLSAIVPFSLEVTARRSVPPGVFGVLMSLSPAAAALSGFLVLGQHLTLQQLFGMATVAVASAATLLSARGRPAASSAVEDHGSSVATSPTATVPGSSTVA
ncbi:MAG: EamA family transporter [Actinomycetota bacterium]|nr:EamA family transporter [Actinomycetota bacterium]